MNRRLDRMIELLTDVYKGDLSNISLLDVETLRCMERLLKDVNEKFKDV